MTDGQIVQTHNGYGWTSTVPNQITIALLDWLRTLRHPAPVVLDIGSGLGVGTLPLLEAGARVIALDIEESHLASIRQVAECRSVAERLITVAGRFPGSLRFDQLDAIHCSNVLHFLPGSDIVTGAARMYGWLKPGGKVFLQVGTVYAGHIKQLLPIFEHRRQAGVRWAGETFAAKVYVAAEFRDATPPFMNYLDSAPLLEAFKAAGFTIDREWYYTRHGLPENLRRDGREHFGIIASCRSSEN
jgi:SAM-dependent methyltransferase